jgi:hypothetical protein
VLKKHHLGARSSLPAADAVGVRKAGRAVMIWPPGERIGSMPRLRKSGPTLLGRCPAKLLRCYRARRNSRQYSIYQITGADHGLPLGGNHDEDCYGCRYAECCCFLRCSSGSAVRSRSVLQPHDLHQPVIGLEATDEATVSECAGINARPIRRLWPSPAL